MVARGQLGMWVALAGMVCVGGVVAAYEAGYRPDHEWFGAWAGWAQAISAAAAIYAAGRLASREILDRGVQSMDAFHGIVRQVRDGIQRSITELTTPTGFSSWGVPDTARFGDLEKMLSAVPVFELGANRGAEMIGELLHVVRRARELFENNHVLTAAPEWLVMVIQLEADADGLLDTVAHWRARREAAARDWLVPKPRT